MPPPPAPGAVHRAHCAGGDRDRRQDHTACAALRLALAEGARGLGRAREAIAHYRAALELDPDLLTAANNLAWMLATHPEPAVRDPAAALALAERISRAGAGSELALLDTLAAAVRLASCTRKRTPAEVRR